MEEIWKDIEGFENRYQISNTGKVRSLDTYQDNPLTGGKSLRKGKILTPWLEKGYLRVGLSIGDKKHRYFSVHKLVANSFIENLLNKPHINHIDGDKFNNNSINLEWCTPAENVTHSIHTLQRNNTNKWVVNIETGIFYLTIKEASESLGRRNIRPSYLGAMLLGRWKNRTPIRLTA